MKLIIIVMVALLPTAICASPKSDHRRSAYIDGDFIFGTLFSVHHQPKREKSNNYLKCGEIREMYGIQRVEVTFQTLDWINRDHRILPNITLGAEIRDSCWYAPVALQQSIELIRDSISANSIGRNDGSVRECTIKNDTSKLQPFLVKRHQRPLIGVVGPGSSSIALQVQNLLQLFSIPQIGYSTTSKDLSDKNRFSYFLRVVPSDYYQAQVMVDVVKRFNWTYVSAVNTDENYGQSGIQAFRELAEKSDICIAKEDSILSSADEEDFNDVILNLVQDTNARVVVCFCEGLTVRGLLGAIARLNLTGQLLFIGSDGWADRYDVVDKYEPQALGSLSIRIHSAYESQFDPYYFALKPHTNKRNPWFEEFWEHKFSCKFGKDGENATDVTDKIKEDKVCSGMENLTERYKQDPKLSFVRKAILTLAYGLHNMQQEICGRNSSGICQQMIPFNGSLFKSYLLNVTFTHGDGEVIEFDSKGDPPGRYDIMNYQLLENGSYAYLQVGNWKNGTLTFTNTLQFGPKETGIKESVCSKPCHVGYYKNFQKGGQDKKCCWVCVACGENAILLNETSCKQCPPGFWPNSNKTNCSALTVEFVQWHDTEAIVSITFATIGLLSTIFGSIVFIRYNNTPVVKSSTRELSYIILLGMFVSYAATFAIIAEPTKYTCALTRLLPGISFSMIYASLLTKTNRIARILAGSKKRFPSRKLRFMSTGSQLFITIVLIGIEVVCCVTMLFYEPSSSMFYYPTIKRVKLVCNTTPFGILVPAVFNFILIVLCTIYAVKTRNVPENFNEAKFIGFSMYTTYVIWIAFGPIYFGSELKIITMCLCISLSALVIFIFLFVPKLYIILLHPERNNRALFTTSKSIRCHIGSRVASAISEKSSSVLCSSISNPERLRSDLLQTDVARLSFVGTLSKNLGPFNSSLVKYDQKSHSCQTSGELYESYLNDTHQLMKTSSINLYNSQRRNSSLRSYAGYSTPPKQGSGHVTDKKYKNHSRGYTAKVGDSTTNSPVFRGANELKNCKMRIREESISNSSVDDLDYQLKQITISLGPISSIDSPKLSGFVGKNAQLTTIRGGMNRYYF